MTQGDRVEVRACRVEPGADAVHAQRTRPFDRILASPVLTRGRWPIFETMNEIQGSGYVQRVGYVLLALDRDACETEGKPKQFPGGHKPVVSVLQKIRGWVAAGSCSVQGNNRDESFLPVPSTLR